MSGLPVGWASVPLRNLVVLNPKNHAPDDAEAAFMPMPHLGTSFRHRPTFEVRLWGEIVKSYVHFAEGDVLLAKITPCFENGKAGIPNGLPNGIGAGSSEYFVCRTHAQALLPRWLLAYFKTSEFLRSGAQHMTGSVGHKRVPKDYLLDSEIPLPPLPEQQRIADKLDAILARVDACRDRLDRVGPLLQRFRQSVLAAATNGGLTEGADDWTEVSVGDVASGFSYGSAAKSSPAGAVPVLRMGNLQRGALDWSDLVYTSDTEEIEKYRLAPGDLLFNRTNSPELVGKTAVFKGEREAIYAGYLIRVRCGEALLPDYLHYCLSSPAGRAYCWQVKSDGVSQSNINAKKLAAFTFKLPTIDDQRVIVARCQRLLGFADALEARLRIAEVAALRITSATLAKAFRGELVPQDPADEPAEALLAQIATGTAAQPPARRRGRRADYPS